MKKKEHRDCIDFNESAAVHDCTSTGVTPITTPGGAAGNIVAKIPVTLAERNVSTNLSVKIKFPYPVLEIKDVKKRLKVVQCSLILPPVAPGQNPFTPADGQLFLKGFLRKNIQYASPMMDKCHDNGSSSCISSTIRSHTVEIPWECVVTIPAGAFLAPPQRPVLNTRGEYDFHISRELGHGYPEKDHLLTSDLSQFHQQSNQFYNEFPFCELISSSINEWDEAIDRKPLHGYYPSLNEGYFHTLVEKVFLQFTIKVLQKQQARVNVVGTAGVQEKCPKDDDYEY
jgi:hypothetical protein